MHGVVMWLMAAWAISFHVLSLRWLRAPAWKNKQEALTELQRLVAEEQSVSYSDWVSRIGQVKHVEFTSASGIWYQVKVEPIWDDRPHGAVRVFVSLDDGGVGAYHPLTDCLLVEPPA